MCQFGDWIFEAMRVIDKEHANSELFLVNKEAAVLD